VTSSADKARIALTVYLDRGKAAIQHFQRGEADALDTILQKRAAAFHNFAAIDHKALSEGADIATDPKVIALWKEIETVNRELAELMRGALDRSNRQLVNGSSVRHVTKLYHSGEPTPIRFVKVT